MEEFSIEVRDGSNRLIYSICGSLPYLDDAVRDVTIFMRKVKETGKFPEKPVIKSLVEEV